MGQRTGNSSAPLATTGNTPGTATVSSPTSTRVMQCSGRQQMPALRGVGSIPSKMLSMYSQKPWLLEIDQFRDLTVVAGNGVWDRVAT